MSLAASIPAAPGRAARRDATTIHLFRDDGMISSNTRPGDQVAELSVLALRFMGGRSIIRVVVTRDLGHVSATVMDTGELSTRGLSGYSRSRHLVETYMAVAWAGISDQQVDLIGTALEAAFHIEAGPFSPLWVSPGRRIAASLTLLSQIHRVPEEVGAALAVVASGMKSAY